MQKAMRGSTVRMVLRAFVAATMLLLLHAAPADAVPDPTDADIDELSAMADAMDADVEKPGDDNLTCEQLGNELTSITADAKVQSSLQQLGAPEALIAGFNRQKDTLVGTMRAAYAMRMLTYATAAVPGLAVVSGAAETALIFSAAKQQENMAKQGANKIKVVAPVLPRLMRASYVVELARGKTCSFVKEAAKPAG